MSLGPSVMAAVGVLVIEMVGVAKGVEVGAGIDVCVGVEETDVPVRSALGVGIGVSVCVAFGTNVSEGVDVCRISADIADTTVGLSDASVAGVTVVQAAATRTTAIRMAQLPLQ